MANKKLLHFDNLQSFWAKAEAWITANLKALYDQGEKFEENLELLNDEIQKNKGNLTIEASHELMDDEYTEEDVLAVITPDTFDDEDSSFLEIAG